MLQVKVKLKNKKFSVPVPYPILKLVGLMISSKRMNRLINKAIEQDGSSKFIFPEINRKDLEPLFRAISQYKGVTLVDTKLKDGTEVKVKL